MALTTEQRASARALVEKSCAAQGIPVEASPAQMLAIGGIVMAARRRSGAELSTSTATQPPRVAVGVECSAARPVGRAKVTTTPHVEVPPPSPGDDTGLAADLVRAS